MSDHPPTYQQTIDGATPELKELRRRIGDPGAYTPRGWADEPFAEPLQAWSARAVAMWLAERDGEPERYWRDRIAAEIDIARSARFAEYGDEYGDNSGYLRGMDAAYRIARGTASVERKPSP